MAFRSIAESLFYRSSGSRLRGSRSFRRGSGCECLVIDPEQSRGEHANSGHCPPNSIWLVRNFAEMMQQHAAQPSADERADADRQKRKSHVSALLSGGREARNVFVV